MEHSMKSGTEYILEIDGVKINSNTDKKKLILTTIQNGNISRNTKIFTVKQEVTESTLAEELMSYLEINDEKPIVEVEDTVKIKKELVIEQKAEKAIKETKLVQETVVENVETTEEKKEEVIESKTQPPITMTNTVADILVEDEKEEDEDLNIFNEADVPKDEDNYTTNDAMEKALTGDDMLND